MATTTLYFFIFLTRQVECNSCLQMVSQLILPHPRPPIFCQRTQTPTGRLSKKLALTTHPAFPRYLCSGRTSRNTRVNYGTINGLSVHQSVELKFNHWSISDYRHQPTPQEVTSPSVQGYYITSWWLHGIGQALCHVPAHHQWCSTTLHRLLATPK